MDSSEDHNSLIGQSKFWRKFWFDIAPGVSGLAAILAFYFLISVSGAHKALQYTLGGTILFLGASSIVYLAEYKHEAYFLNNAEVEREKMKKFLASVKARADAGETITSDDLLPLGGLLGL